MSEYWKVAGAVILPNVGGIMGGLITRKNLDSWYKKLNFPSYRPPNWIFGPMWTSIYSSMGYASYLVWRDGGSSFTGDAKWPLITYGTQLALNWAWTPIFFGSHNIKGGLIDLAALTATASLCGVLFYHVNKTAGLLFVPYIAWLSFASMLNYSVYKLNPEENKKSKAVENTKQE
ncbi:translocator protein [Musca domestica]|uniref:Translocator protein n=1 Tax=Musca domestica TaxID=7370 RepID=A0A1I8N4J3_MUSDO|nr:translocator protein [Musca domestica]